MTHASLGSGTAPASASPRRARSEERQPVADWYELLEGIHEISAESIVLSQAVERLARLLLPRLGDAVAVHLWDSGRWREISCAWNGRDWCTADRPRDMEQEWPGGAARAFQTRQTVVFSDGGADSPARVCAEGRAAQFICTPLVVRRWCLGTITFARSTATIPYGDAAVELAESLAGSLAPVLDGLRREETVRQELDEFVAIAAHELRTPTAALLLHLELLARDLGRVPLPLDTAESLKRRAAKAGVQCRRMVELANRLMDVSRIELGQFALEPGRTDLTETVRAVASRLSLVLAHAGCELSVRADEPVVGQWDRLRLEQVVANLMMNAVKYAPGAPIEVLVFAAGETAMLAVQDSGPGISVGDQGRIFDRFQRGVRARQAGGVGLGLYVSRRIVEAHGGDISVSSEPGQGATFVVRLPRRRPADAALS